MRPQVVTTFELPGCVDMWTVLSGDMVSEKKSKKWQIHIIIILGTKKAMSSLQFTDCYSFECFSFWCHKVSWI